jgi:predicted acylesterase/phospholipase RssA
MAKIWVIFSGRSLVVLAAMLLVACIQRPKEALEIRTIRPMEAVDPIKMVAKSANRVDADGVYRILALSSGGADGAYGAGVLVGWSESGKRPQFDVVTGVSTGALMAVLAFLGPEYDKLMEQLYTTVSSKDIFRKRGLAAAFSDSLYDYGPLKKQIEEVITEELLVKVAAEHAKGRRLFVATTNLDAGELVIWNMGDIADGGRSNPLQHFQKVLRASAAVPGYFPPVYIKPQRGVQLRQSHVDGGVKAPILVSDAMFVSKLKRRQLFMIVNGNTARFNSSHPVSGKLADIASKSIIEMMREMMDDTIYRGYVAALNSGMDFHMTAIPDEILPSQESLDFNSERMHKLFAAGRKVGKAGIKDWQNSPPRLGRYERLAVR